VAYGSQDLKLKAPFYRKMRFNMILKSQSQNQRGAHMPYWNQGILRGGMINVLKILTLLTSSLNPLKYMKKIDI
jgi:hypothetical protein